MILPTITKEMINEPPKEVDIDCLPQIIPLRFFTNIGTAHFEGLFIVGDSPVLYVFLPAARELSASLPRFIRWSRHSLIQGSVICIEDPMYYNYPNLKFGYFIGNKTEDYTKYLALVIKKIAFHNNIPENNIIFYGSSAGGTVGINVSKYFNNSLSFSINPQILPKVPRRFNDNFKENIGTDLTKINSTHYTKNALSNNNSKIIIMCNKQSIEDFRTIAEFMNENDIEFDSEFTIKNNVAIILYSSFGNPNPHNCFETPALFKLLQVLFNKLLIEKIPLNKDEYSEMVDAIVSVWNEHHNMIYNEYYSFIDYKIKNSYVFDENEIKNLKNHIYNGNLNANKKLSEIYDKKICPHIIDIDKIKNNTLYPDNIKYMIATFDYIWNLNTNCYDDDLFNLIMPYAYYKDPLSLVRLARLYRDGRGTSKDLK